MVLRPVGDQPASVYWVRRGLALALVLLVVALVWWWWPFGDDAAPPPETPTADATPTATATATATPTPTKTKTATKTPTAELAVACADADVQVTVAVDAESYPPGRPPSFTLAVENVSEETCSRDVGQVANELRVTSGGVQVWSSDDCNPGGAEELIDLDPEDRFVQTVSWDRVTSSDGCPAGAAEAEAGTYQVVARNGEILSEPAVFVLE